MWCNENDVSRLLWHLRSPDHPCWTCSGQRSRVIVKATDKGEYLFIRYSISPVEFPRHKQSVMPFTILFFIFEFFSFISTTIPFLEKSFFFLDSPEYFWSNTDIILLQPTLNKTMFNSLFFSTYTELQMKAHNRCTLMMCGDIDNQQSEGTFKLL